MSKFRSILNAAKGREVEPELVPEQPQSQPDLEMKKPASVPARRGRPKGKRSDPDYEQVTAYIRRDTHTQVKIALLQEDNKREFSELIQALLDEYLSTQKSKNSKT